MFIVNAVFKYFDYVVRAKSSVTKEQIDGETLIFQFWLWANFIISMILTMGASYFTVAVIQTKLGYFTEYGLWVLSPIVAYGLLSVIVFSTFNLFRRKVEVKRIREMLELERLEKMGKVTSAN
ncbi:hypothetical protein P4493_06095 [Bacillus thuringiensis]|jgi:hypothetical protein|uniref:Uncharacterized protein n=3 Tax=Bacillus thuringiensis TaxID=1428 RepID=A0A0B5NBK7_BACTU|nr:MULTISPECIES: hypothetical protein [Bacillus]EAO53436.1 hypothetical protein RBTH_04827 [Bacillus thuringiensis serovar israelensis ATCC 35646]MEC2533135.1 hypothetical protein [Bacillus cereus]MED1153885.1 hypothetical protein [Bacillus paranthracis]OUB09268.1 hypothetical protein BK708_32570 [Bacillus thuringiensis serovar yunnanensis]AFQ30193.1 hypothetical protein BTF1_30462 [Bacillus thuringiensis HD-789]